jgi:hypothetical protein
MHQGYFRSRKQKEIENKYEFCPSPNLQINLDPKRFKSIKVNYELENTLKQLIIIPKYSKHTKKDLILKKHYIDLQDYIDRHRKHENYEKRLMERDKEVLLHLLYKKSLVKPTVITKDVMPKLPSGKTLEIKYHRPKIPYIYDLKKLITQNRISGIFIPTINDLASKRFAKVYSTESLNNAESKKRASESPKRPLKRIKLEKTRKKISNGLKNLFSKSKSKSVLSKSKLFSKFEKNKTERKTKKDLNEKNEKIKSLPKNIPNDRKSITRTAGEKSIWQKSFGVLHKMYRSLTPSVAESEDPLLQRSSPRKMMKNLKK